MCAFSKIWNKNERPEQTTKISHISLKLCKILTQWNDTWNTSTRSVARGNCTLDLAGWCDEILDYGDRLLRGSRTGSCAPTVASTTFDPPMTLNFRDRTWCWPPLPLIQTPLPVQTFYFGWINIVLTVFV